MISSAMLAASRALIPPVVSQVPIVGRRGADGRPTFRLAYDAGSRLVRGEAHGGWSLEDAEAYAAGLKAFLEASRAVAGKGLILVDRRLVERPSPEVAEYLCQANLSMFEAEDKLALVVRSSMAKAELRHRLPHSGTKAFLSLSAAETWLQAHM